MQYFPYYCRLKEYFHKRIEKNGSEEKQTNINLIDSDKFIIIFSLP